MNLSNCDVESNTNFWIEIIYTHAIIFLEMTFEDCNIFFDYAKFYNVFHNIEYIVKT